MQHLPAIFQEDAEPRLLATEVVLWNLPCLLVIVLRRHHVLIDRDMEVVVEIRSLGGEPRHVPTHALLELRQLVKSGTRDEDEGGAAGAEVLEMLREKF
jgi:hypothetical protein